MGPAFAFFVARLALTCPEERRNSKGFQAAGAAQALAAVFRPRRTRQAAVITRSAPGESILLSPFEKVDRGICFSLPLRVPDPF